MGAEVVLAPLGVVQTWLQYFGIYIGYNRNERENSEAKPSKMCIGYVKDAALSSYLVPSLIL